MKASEMVKELLQMINERGDCDLAVTDLEAEPLGEVCPCGFNLVTSQILIRVDNEQ